MHAFVVFFYSYLKYIDTDFVVDGGRRYSDCGTMVVSNLSCSRPNMLKLWWKYSSYSDHGWSSIYGEEIFVLIVKMLIFALKHYWKASIEEIPSILIVFFFLMQKWIYHHRSTKLAEISDSKQTIFLEALFSTFR